MYKSGLDFNKSQTETREKEKQQADRRRRTLMEGKQALGAEQPEVVTSDDKDTLSRAVGHLNKE